VGKYCLNCFVFCSFFFFQKSDALLQAKVDVMASLRARDFTIPEEMSDTCVQTFCMTWFQTNEIGKTVKSMIEKNVTLPSHTKAPL
jgi:hypothetical protein